MPKKFSSENTKAVAARARKAAAREEEVEKSKKAFEDEYWKDDDKNLQRKQQRKVEKERKKQEQLEKKAKTKAEYEKELTDLKVTNKNPLPKITRAQIQDENEKRQIAAISSSSKTQTSNKSRVEELPPLEENINRTTEDYAEARSVTEAIEVLSIKNNVSNDQHPERRMKAAYAAFEEKMMPILKSENPTLRHSQLKQMLYDLWLSSPDNPFNK